MAPQDDLTADRAAKIIQSVFLANEKEWRTWYAAANSGSAQQPVPDGVAQRLVAAVAASMKTARQEALLEASQVVRNRALLWRSHGGAKVGFPYGHLTIEGEYESMADELDRLASEGGRGDELELSSY